MPVDLQCLSDHLRHVTSHIVRLGRSNHCDTVQRSYLLTNLHRTKGYHHPWILYSFLQSKSNELYPVMASSPALFTASRSQTLTYLLAVCPFSIAFLVYINSSISFVVTDLIGLQHGEGDAVGTLGFADELLALVACPLWGVLSDRIGVRHVSFLLAHIGVIRNDIDVR